MNDIFITASGTDVGKTFVAERLIREFNEDGISCDAIKPIATGFDMSVETDTTRLLSALGRDATPENIAACSPWRFIEPLSPNLAAIRENTEIDVNAVVEFCRRPCASRIRLIEGIGGVMVPLNSQFTVLDLIARLRVPSLLVVGSYLGALSHALTAAGALQDKELEIAAIIVNESIEQPVTLSETVDTLQQFCPGIPIASVHRETRTRPEASPQIIAANDTRLSTLLQRWTE